MKEKQKTDLPNSYSLGDRIDKQQDELAGAMERFERENLSKN